MTLARLPEILATVALLTVLCACSLGGPQGDPGLASAGDATSQRSLASGEVIGLTAEHGNHAWLGIPFASPPVGERRWRAPAPPEPWSSMREALAAGPACPQYANVLAPGEPELGGGIVGSEDCLYLNVYAPRFRPAEVPQGKTRLPVMVWFHGGGNTIGTASVYDGGVLARERGVVVVTTNYRLGALGWLRHPALAAGSDDARDRSGNFGTLDLIRALEWVRDNVASFGGDPGNVTIFGESAGGHDVYTLLVAPGAKGLFHRALSQSGGPGVETPARAENYTDAAEPGHRFSSREVVLALLQAEGAAADRESAKALAETMSPEALAQWLRAKSPSELLGVYEARFGFGMYDSPRVFADGTVLPEREISELLEAGEYQRVPVLLGTNRDEPKIFMFGDPEHVRKLLWLFPRLRDARRYNLEAEYGSLMWKASGADGPAALMARHQPGSVFVYRFDWDEEPTLMGSDLSEMVGAGHGLEIPFVFGRFEFGFLDPMFTEENGPGRRALSSAMTSYWTQFARAGDPGRGVTSELPRWKPWESGPTADKFLVLDTARDGGIRMSTESVTREGVLAALARDARLRDTADRCGIYAQLLEFEDISLEEYQGAGCGASLEDVATR